MRKTKAVRDLEKHYIQRYFLVIMKVADVAEEIAYGPMTSGEADAFMTALDDFADDRVTGRKVKRTDIDTQGLSFGSLNSHKVEEDEVDK